MFYYTRMQCSFIRISCSASDVSLEMDRNACYTKPGCYFDDELYVYRQSYGYAVLPGVPVCHKAIRNARFHQIANKYLQTVSLAF